VDIFISTQCVFGTVTALTGAALAISFVGINTTFYLIAIVFILASCLAFFIPIITHIQMEESFSIGNVFGQTRTGMHAFVARQTLDVTC